eukprot:m.265747 g.265747  ORF g.265747 m.265747 type:complete len:113 (+) comp63472_c0_seq1:76-414(+)
MMLCSFGKSPQFDWRSELDYKLFMLYTSKHLFVLVRVRVCGHIYLYICMYVRTRMIVCCEESAFTMLRTRVVVAVKFHNARSFDVAASWVINCQCDDDDGVGVNVKLMMMMM